MEFFDDNPISN